VQPTNTSEIFVESNDDDVATAYLEGYVLGGHPRSVAVTMTGVVATTFNITNFVELNDFYLSKPAIGTVVLLEDSDSGTELARITIGQTRPNYFGFYLWPTPAAEIDYSVDFRKEASPLTANTSVPPWPTDYHHVLIAYAAWRELVFKGKLAEAGDAKQRYLMGLSRLKYATQVQTDELPVMGRRRPPVGHSRLGGNFPADSWSW
jgi:hypothetical protein